MNRLVMVLDFVVILAGATLYWVASPVSGKSLTGVQAYTVALVLAIAFTWVMRDTGSYRVERYSRFFRTVADLLRAFVPAVVAAGLIVWAFAPMAWHQGTWLLGGVVVIFAVLVAGRFLARLLKEWVERTALLRRRVVVVGYGTIAETVVAQVTDPRCAQDYELVGVYDRRGGTRDGANGVERIPSVADLREYARDNAVDMVVIAMPMERIDEISALIQQFQWMAADVVIPFPKIGLRPQFVPPLKYSDTPLVEVLHRPFKGSQGLIKVAEDYLVAGIGLLFASPFLLGAMLAIKLTDPGPIFFKQPRVGFNNKIFMMLKLRSMTVDPTDDGSRGTDRNDKRITKVGAFIRRTSIDELPQLLNVLRGEMSIVGPRPHVANMLVGEGVYSEVVREYAARHRIKPGITGWAQINGMRGGIHSLERASRGAELDLYYVANWSWKLDVKIMIRTLVTGLVGRDIF